jgi:hypothetical protein
MENRPEGPANRPEVWGPRPRARPGSQLSPATPQPTRRVCLGTGYSA